jgi:hypothetical protein
MTDTISRYRTITLEEMSKVRLMNRIDTKYVTNTQMLERLLQEAEAEYRVQSVDGELNSPYHTVYFDTERFAMYNAHLLGRKQRQKVRLRQYVSSGISFLEVKRKNNKGRTDKRRIPSQSLDEADCPAFIAGNTAFSRPDLLPRISNDFHRITLVNNRMTERVTIDTDLRFHNLTTGVDCDMADIVVIELKRDGLQESPFASLLRRMRVFPGSFSKYCVGMALTDPSLRINRFKPNLHKISKLGRIRICGPQGATPPLQHA